MTARVFLERLLILLFAFSATAWSHGPVLVREGSSMTYRLVHPLHRIESTSKDVVYSVDVDVATKLITRVTAHVDVTTFDSGNSNRDSHAMEVIDAMSFPEADFVSTAILRTGDSLSVAGRLTFHGITKEVMAAAVTQWSETRLSVNGSFDFNLSAFGIERPSLLMIPVDDTLSFTFVAVFALEKK